MHYEFSFEDIKNYFQKHFDFKISSLERPYKFCDYRPAYGELFQEYLTGYDFWGHCDIDLLWGDFRKFVTDDVLSKYNRIYYFGACCLYRNTPEVNSWYRTLKSDKRVNYKQAFSSEKSLAFDEWPGMIMILRDNGMREYEVKDFVNQGSLDEHFFKIYDYSDLSKIKDLYFEWNNGNTYACHHGKIINEFVYVHGKFKPAEDLKNNIPEKFYLLSTGYVTAQENEITKFKREPLKIFYYRTRHKLKRGAMKLFVKYFPYRLVNFVRYLRRRLVLGLKF